MGPGGSSAEVTGASRRLRASSTHRRRTSLRVWCGVIFFAASYGCNAANQVAGDRSATVVTIGVPESTVNIADLGTGFLVTNATLEGLTELITSPDGRPLPRLATSWAWENG